MYHYRRKKGWLKFPLLAFVLPFVLLLIVELIERGGSLRSFGEWFYLGPKSLILSYLLMFGAMNVVGIFFRRIYWSFLIVLVPSSLFALVSRIKLGYRGEPLLPSDFSLTSEAGDIVSEFHSIISFKIILLSVLFVALIVLLIMKMPRNGYGWITRSILAVLAVVVFFSVYKDKPVALKQKLAIVPITWDQKMNYDTNGMFLGFILDLKWLKVQIPADYNEAKVKAVAQNIPRRTNVNPNVNPNIIIVMSEAFWDPTLMDQVSFSQDPVPFFHSLEQNYTSGYMMSPVFGGGTVNTEFEVLTGFSTHFLPYGAIAYAQYVNKPLDSMASILRGQGYVSTAVHTYHDWFYRRNIVYQDLGFNKFVSMEFFNNPELKGDFIADSEISKKIVEETQSTPGPDFIYAVTMEDHGPYPPDNRPDPITVSGADLSKDSVGLLERYTRNINDADKALQQLVQSYENSDEPTMIVFYGDHLPLLGENYQVYQEAHFFQDDTNYPDYLKKYSVPFVIWDNFQDKGSRAQGLRMNASFLGSYILNMAQKKGSTFMDYVYSLYNSGLHFIPNENFYAQASVDPAQLDDYKLLQYDQLFGKGYSYAPDEQPISNDGYFLGSGKMTIDQATVGSGSGSGGPVLQVSGSNFVENSQIYVGGEALKTDFIDGTHISAALPQKWSGSGSFTVEVKVIDSMNRVIAESNQVAVKVPASNSGE